ncbi:uncharacterized protein LOC120355963, partial [Nilaparvata lugens]|uniref:uncharacterized protein LOC120355963 n=1 Tax=Nilaparvata lugens TaxID=108931 RepID=UPI00193C9DCC
FGGLTDVKCETTNDTSSSVGGAQLTVNNQSEKEGGAKLVLKCKTPAAQPKSKEDTTNLEDKDNLEVAEDGDSEEETEIIVLPDHMMLEEAVVVGGKSGSEGRKEKTKIGNEKSEIEHNLTIEEDTDYEAKDVSCDGLKFRKAKKRVLKGKDTRKRSYSEAAMQAPLKTCGPARILSSQHESTVSEDNTVLSSRRIGACHRIHRKGYPMEQMNGALEAVA